MDGIYTIAPEQIIQLYNGGRSTDRLTNLVILTPPVGEIYNIYLTSDQKVLDSEINANNLLLITEFAPKDKPLTIQSLTEEVLYYLNNDFQSARSLPCAPLNTTIISNNWLNNAKGVIGLGSSLKESYIVVDPPGDGNCFFNSFIEALKLNKQNRNQVPAEIVISKVINFFKKHWDSLSETIKIIIESPTSYLDCENKLSIYILRYILSLHAATVDIWDGSDISGDDVFGFRGYKHMYYDKKKDRLLNTMDPGSAQDDALAENKILLDDTSPESLSNFQNFILSSDYWADDWAIGCLQKICNIQFAIFQEGGVHRCTGCRALDSDDSGLLKNPIILLNWKVNVHFQLVIYNEQAVFDQSNYKYLPDCIKKSCDIHTSQSLKSKPTKKILKVKLKNPQTKKSQTKKK